MSDSTHLPDDQTESQLSLENCLAGHVSAHQDAAVSNSLVGVVVAGRDVATSESLCNISVAGRDLHLRQGYGGILVAGNRAMVDGSTIGLLLGKPGNSFTNSRVLMTGRHAIAFGAAMGTGLCPVQRPAAPQAAPLTATVPSALNTSYRLRRLPMSSRSTGENLLCCTWMWDSARCM
jgi:hypothetical protein